MCQSVLYTRPVYSLDEARGLSLSLKKHRCSGWWARSLRPGHRRAECPLIEGQCTGRFAVRNSPQRDYATGTRATEVHIVTGNRTRFWSCAHVQANKAEANKNIGKQLGGHSAGGDFGCVWIQGYSMYVEIFELNSQTTLNLEGAPSPLPMNRPLLACI
jgi:hypothetical protein